MARIRVVHWNASEAAPLLATLRSAGHETDYDEKLDGKVFRAIRQSPPDVFVIDLTRLPSHGREIATALRGFKATRHVPIVFAGGVAEKVEAIRRELPDALYTDSARVRSAVRKALANPPANPVVPTQMMDRYATRTAAQKLGIVEGSRVALFDPPREYAKAIGQVPAGVTFEEAPGEPCPVTLWFVRDPDAYRSGLRRMRNLAAHTRFWALWPKRTARKDSSVNEQLLRDAALAVGLVDYKVCAVNETWSGLAFARKKDDER